MAPVLSMSGYFSDHMHRCIDKWSPFFSFQDSRYLFFFLMTVFYFFGHAAHGILVLWPGLKPRTPALEVHSLKHWIAREAASWHPSWKRCLPSLPSLPTFSSPSSCPAHTSTQLLLLEPVKSLSKCKLCLELDAHLCCREKMQQECRGGRSVYFK